MKKLRYTFAKVIEVVTPCQDYNTAGFSVNFIFKYVIEAPDQQYSVEYSIHVGMFDL